jgi:sensor c-di-GMP phosphodiesterase-like protein
MPDRPGDQLDIMHATRDCFPVAIDDFGTGYSSLTHLKHFPIGTRKIDISSSPISRPIRGTPRSRRSSGAQTSLGLKIVAEGVGTREQLEFLDVRVATRLGSN